MPWRCPCCLGGRVPQHRRVELGLLRAACSGRLLVELARHRWAREQALPWERTAERNAYRDSHITLEQATRDLQEQEDMIKLEVRDRLGGLIQARESYVIQARAVRLAEQRVRSTELFLDAGQVPIRDWLDAQEDLVNAQNARTAALVDYRVAELEFQRDTGTLQVNTKGLWREFDPSDNS